MIVTEASETGCYNVADIQKVFRENHREISDELAMKVKELLFDVSQMPVNLFEAKPRRAVGFDEVRAAVVPADTSAELKQKIESLGIPVIEYERDNANDRLRKVNSVEGIKFSARDYARQVDEVKNNTHDRNNHVYMGTTPAGIVNIIGLPKLPMLVTANHIYSMAVSAQQAKAEKRYNSKVHYHDLGWDAVKALPDYINKPVLIIKSNTDPNDARFVVITSQTDSAGRPIMAAIKPNGAGNYFNIEFPTNVMLSSYGRTGIQGYVARAKTENRILYANKNSQKQKNTKGVQFSNNILASDYSANLAQFKGIVKGKFAGTIFENGGLPKFSLRDTAGRELTAEQQEYFRDSKVRDEQGRLMVMYHGTPNGSHTKFRSSTYFTPIREYADKYQNPNASMLSTKKNADAPKTYEVYLNITKPFDTRNPAERQIFMEEYYRKWGTGAPLADSGLPDWTDGMDLQEFIEEMDYDYDGLILDEGATGGYGLEVRSRGLSYVTFSSDQVKNVDNAKPTDNPDIRFSDRDPAAVALNRALEKENAALADEIGYLREMVRLQGKVTNGTKFTRSSVQALAGELMKEAGARGDRKELAEILSGVYEHIAGLEDPAVHSSWDDIAERTGRAAQWLAEHIEIKPDRGVYADEGHCKCVAFSQ